jgi:murein DD-endopeptidase MepM/ murein hydrolase activator NlpD
MAAGTHGRLPKAHSMARRLAVVLILLPLLVAGSAWGADSYDRKRQVDAKIAELRKKIENAKQKEAVLSEEIAAVTSKIRALEDDVAAASARVGALEAQLAASKNRLAALTQIFQLQTQKLELLTRQHTVAEQRLNERLVAIYQSSDPTAVEVVLSARSFNDILDQLDYLRELGEQDRRIARQVKKAQEEMRTARLKTQATRKEVTATTREIQIRTEEQRVERNRLVSAQEQLDDVRSVKQRTLAAVQVSKKDYLHEVSGLERASATLAARIQAAQRAARPAVPSASSAPDGDAPSAPSASGMIWPVSGPVTSGFGWRWGRMHEGIDIGAPTGAPIRATASGTVIFAGWMDGYGQLVVVDHGGGVATAYAHMSSMASSVGQGVVQGQVIGYVGCTGHCYGSHLHFEVRVNGAAVDPLRYL